MSVTPIKLVEFLRRYPRSLQLLTDGELVDLLQYNRIPDLARYPVAELLCRCWLYQEQAGNALNAAAVEWTGADRLAAWRSLTAHCRKAPETGAVTAAGHDLTVAMHAEALGGDCKGLAAEVYVALQRYLDADGIIPVARGDEALPLTFRLAGVSRVAVVDIAGVEIPNWHDSFLRQWPDSLHRRTVQLDVAVNDILPPLDGESFGLPVLLADLQKRGLLERHPLRRPATGAISNGQLMRVEEMPAKEQLARRLGATLIFPGGAIPVGIAHDKIRDQLAEHEPVTLDWRAAQRECKKIDGEMEAGIVSPADALIRLDQVEAALQDPEREHALMDARLVRAAALCHLGRADDSELVNAENRETAERLEAWPALGRAVARTVVNLTDFGRYPEAIAVARDFEKQLGAGQGMNHGDVTDIRMRLAGSLGQAQMFAALAGGDDVLRAAALDSFEKALECAERHSSEGESVRDLNLRHFYFACFMPGTNEETAAARKAESAAEKLSDAAEGKNNLAFLARQRWFAAYRLCLAGETPVTDELPEPDTVERGWLSALIYKYRGAIRAAAGDDGASEDFHMALKLLKHEQTPMMSLLRMTVATQCWRSLASFPEHEELTTECQDMARDFFSSPPIQDMFAFASDWAAFLADPDRTNPQLTYPY